jgi:hypothetical protein
VERPFWRLARHTSEKEGKRVFLLAGCQHVSLVCDPKKICRTPEEWEATEAIWAKQAESLFEIMTQRWTPADQERFRRAIEGKHSLPS